MEAFFIIGLLLVLFFILTVIILAVRYKRCPSDKILVVYGNTGNQQASKCIHGGASFVWPIIQDYGYLDLTPVSIDVDLKGALSKQNIRINVPSQFTVGISIEPGIMENAADRLLGINQSEVKHLAENIITGQLRLVVATMDIEEINSDRDKFLDNVSSNVESELKKIGLKLINVNLTDIQDESGYIEALGKEAAAKAINDAKKSVAEKLRDGEIGAAMAHKDQRIEVSAADAVAKVGEADANADSIEGENLAKIKIADSDADRRQREAEAEKKASSTEKIQAAEALEMAYFAQKKAEEARAELEKASQVADTLVDAEIEKLKIEIDADAEAEKVRREAKGIADGILLKKKAQAAGQYEVLEKQAAGFKQLVQAAGGRPKDAVLMLIADKLPELVKTQVEAIKNIQIDKVTVWENGNQDGKGNATSNFISGLYNSVPPMSELFNMAGMELPGYLGKKNKDESTNESTVDDVELEDSPDESE